MAFYEKCTVCGLVTGQLKRHLVKAHDWRYTEESPHMPVPIKEKTES